MDPAPDSHRATLFSSLCPDRRPAGSPLQHFFVSWPIALGLGSSQRALKPGIPGTPPPGPHAKATGWCRQVKTSATAAGIIILFSQRVLPHWPAIGEHTSAHLLAGGIASRSKSEAQACTRAVDRMFQERSWSEKSRAGGGKHPARLNKRGT